ncbi:hypothetical protein GC170_12330 [bacterium]|nr:hypothetical protein [bacterium]
MPRNRKMLTFLATIALAAHVAAASRANMPSQDGIKFISIARDFGLQPTWDVIRSADQHPAYPALVAVAHAVVGSFGNSPAASWLAAAQCVSIIAAVFTLIPLYLLTLRLFRPTTALLAVFLWLLLPVPFTLGHETLADATGLCFMAWALWLGTNAIAAKSLRARAGWSAAAGFLSACAYWTRPEGLLVAFSIGTLLALYPCDSARSKVSGLMPFGGVILAGITAYLTINGTVTDRIHAFRVQPSRQVVRTSQANLPKGLPPALRDPRFDFSPKDPATERTRPGLRAAGWSILRLWSENLGIALAVMTLWGLARTRSHDVPTRRLITLHAAVLLATLTLQSATRGYLSSRHVAGLTFLSIPFAAAALRLCGLRLAAIFQLPSRSRRIGLSAALAAMAAIGVTLHSKPIHASRQPHYQAGQWLAANAPPGSAVFDTRGWAAYLADMKRYDPYHFAQAVSDRNTKFWVVELDELTSGSRRAFTLGSILADGGYQEAVFRRKPGREDGGDVLVFSWRRPAWWDRPERITRPERDSNGETPIDDELRQAGHTSRENESR